MVGVCIGATGMLLAPEGQSSAWRTVVLVALLVGTGSGAHRAIKARHFRTGALAVGAVLLLITSLVLGLFHRQ